MTDLNAAPERALHRHNVRVYYEDTDVAGVVYYANYLKFLERGRTEALRDAGVDQSALKDRGFVFVVTRVEIDYRRPARFDDLLTVETRLVGLGRASVEMEQNVLRGDAALAPAKVRLACVTLEGRLAAIPADVRAALSAL